MFAHVIGCRAQQLAEMLSDLHLEQADNILLVQEEGVGSQRARCGSFCAGRPLPLQHVAQLTLHQHQGTLRPSTPIWPAGRY